MRQVVTGFLQTPLVNNLAGGWYAVAEDGVARQIVVQSHFPQMVVGGGYELVRHVIEASQDTRIFVVEA